MIARANGFIDGGQGERKKEGRIKCKHTSFTLCVCASNENASISAWGLV